MVIIPRLSLTARQLSNLKLIDDRVAAVNAVHLNETYRGDLLSKVIPKIKRALISVYWRH